MSSFPIKNLPIKFLKKILEISSFPLREFIGVLIRTAGFRVLIISTSRIGHLVVDIDCVLKQSRLGKIKQQKYLLPYNPKTVANKFFLNLVPSEIVPLAGPRIVKFLLQSRISRLPTDHYSTAIKKTAALYEINAKWDSSILLYKAPAHWEKLRRQKLNSWGFNPATPYVCVHCRTGNYSPGDEFVHSARNIDIHTNTKCFAYLVQAGFNIIRMGDLGMPPAPKIRGLFDYAISGVRNDELDFVIGSGCELFLGCSSGVALIASIYGKPVVSIGMALPFNFSYTGHSNDIGIPKLLRSKKNKKLISFPEVFHSGASEFRMTEELEKSPYELVENTADEIVGVVQEMVLRKRGIWKETTEDKDLQKKMHSLIRPGSYSYGTASRCGALFLRKYRNLLD